LRRCIKIVTVNHCNFALLLTLFSYAIQKMPTI
jgi:hypothetical protein